MKKLPIVIEICGIPYSGKTTTIEKIEKHLRRDKVAFQIINEFRGDGNFYQSSKHTPDLNLVRSLKVLENIVTVKHSNHCDVILVDRGVFDSYCWFKWFEEMGGLGYPLLNLANNLLELMVNYSSKYYVVWMDGEPAVTIRHHSRQGNIVNVNTMTQLRRNYADAFQDKGRDMNLTRIESGSESSDVIASRLIKQFKL